MGLGDRRFFILDLDETFIDNPVYFEPLVAEIDNGGKQAFLHYLKYEVDLTGFKVRDIPQTDSATKLDHKIRSADTITKWLITVLTDGGFTYTEDPDYQILGSSCRQPAFKEWPDHEPLEIGIEEFYKSYSQSVRGHHVEAKQSVSKKVRELLKTDLKKTRPRVAGERPRCYMLPALESARVAMEKVIRQKGPWHDEEQGEDIDE